MQHTGHKYDEAMEVNTIQVEYQMRRDMFARLLSFPLAKVQLSLIYHVSFILTENLEFSDSESKVKTKSISPLLFKRIRHLLSPLFFRLVPYCTA